MSFEIKITKDYDGVKPKSFLKKKLDVSYFKIPRLIKDKRITINGKKIKDDTILRTGDVIKIWPNDIELREVKKNFKEERDLGMEIIFEDEDILVLNKLPGIIVQGAQDHSTSLSLHLAYLQNKSKFNSDFEYFHVHRLDKDTSGVLVIGKNRKTIRDLNELFRSREVEKKYLALVVGKLENKRGRIEVDLIRNPEGSREKMRVAKKNELGGRRSISIYNVLEEFENNGNLFSLVEVEIKTGVTHQIRVHMKYLGVPILGDKMYGNSLINEEYSKIIDRQFLHARELRFNYNGMDYDFKADLVEDLEKCLNFLRKN